MDIGILDHTRKELDVAMYSFTDKQIEKELTKLAHRGVKIRIYRDQEQYSEEKKRAAEKGDLCVTDELAKLDNVQVKIKASQELMHEKDFAADDRLLRTGSANWSIGGLRKQDNIAIYSQTPYDVQRFKRKFAEMWERSDNEILQ